MENLKNHLINDYKNSLQNERRDLDKISNNKAVPLTYLGLNGINESKSWYFLFVEKDIKKAKQCFYLYGKVNKYINIKYENSGSEAPLGMIPSVIYTLLSDSYQLISGFANTPFPNVLYWNKRGALGFVIQEIIKNNDKKALEYLTYFNNKFKKYPLKEQESDILKAIVKGEKQEVEELLKFFLLPKNHKKTNGIYPMRKDLLSFPALGYAKLAWIRGVEVEIDHPLIPKELLPIRPNKEYLDTYDFLRE